MFRYAFLLLCIVLAEIIYKQFMHKLITVNAADKASGVVIVGYIGRILRQDITHKLIDGIVAFHFKRVVY